MKQFILFLHEQPGQFDLYSPDQMQAIIEEYNQWAKSLRQRNHYVNGHQLSPESIMLSKKQGQILTDGPFTETKEIIGGYFVIQAASMEEAMEVSRTCPHLAYEGRVQIRELLLD